MFCPKCGKPNADDAVFCAGCGNKLNAAKAAAGAAGAIAEKHTSKKKTVIIGVVAVIVVIALAVALSGIFGDRPLPSHMRIAADSDGQIVNSTGGTIDLTVQNDNSAILSLSGAQFQGKFEKLESNSDGVVYQMKNPILNDPNRNISSELMQQPIDLKLQLPKGSKDSVTGTWKIQISYYDITNRVNYTGAYMKVNDGGTGVGAVDTSTDIFAKDFDASNDSYLTPLMWEKGDKNAGYAAQFSLTDSDTFFQFTLS